MLTLILSAVAASSHRGPANECEELAELYNANYYDTSPFEGTTGKALSSYLASHGVLLSMCVEVNNGSCLPPKSGHASTSWISNATGPEIFDTTLAKTGIIIDPLSVDVLCTYPMDGATDSRDGFGCGPQRLDKDYGSKGNASLSPDEREAMKTWYQQELERQVGPGKTWQDVRCSAWDWPYKQYIMNGTSISPADRSIEACDKFKKSRLEGPVRYELYLSNANEDYAAILDHPLCVDDLVPCTERNCTGIAFFVFDGSCSWAPGEFQDMVDMQVQIGKIAKHHHLGLWNEVLLNATGFENATQAVFWLGLPGMNASQTHQVQEEAIALSKLHGGKPILRLNLTRPQSPAFSCWRSHPSFP